MTSRFESQTQCQASPAFMSGKSLPQEVEPCLHSSCGTLQNTVPIKLLSKDGSDASSRRVPCDLNYSTIHCWVWQHWSWMNLEHQPFPLTPIQAGHIIPHHFMIMWMVLNLMGQGTSAAQVAPPTPTSTGSPRKSRDRVSCAMAQHATVQICQIGEAGKLEGFGAMWVQRVWVEREYVMSGLQVSTRWILVCPGQSFSRWLVGKIKHHGLRIDSNETMMTMLTTCSLHLSEQMLQPRWNHFQILPGA